jgi:DNA adenine methylase
VLSGYRSDLYDAALRKWDRVEIATDTAQGGKYAARTKVLWSNRPISTPTLFDDIPTP